MTRRHLPVLLILLIAAILRIIALGERNFWYDEAFSALYAEQDISAIIEGTITPADGRIADIHPLLYYLTLHGWMSIFGSSAFVVRLWSVVMGLTTVYVVYLTATTAFDERTGLSAALVTAVAPFHIQYSQEARMYALMGLLLTCATLAFLRAHRAKKQAWRWWALFGICAGLAMHTQQLSGFFLVALGLVPLLRRDRRRIIGLAFGTGIALILFAPWLLILPDQVARVSEGYWVPVPNAARLLLTLRSFTSANLDITPTLSLIALGIGLTVLLFLLLQIAIQRRRMASDERSGILLFLWLFAAPIALMWVFSQFRPVYLDRALIGSGLMLYISLGWLFARGRLPTLIKVPLIAAGLITVGIGLSAHYGWSSFPNSPFREGIQAIAAQLQPGDVVIHQDKTSALPSVFYARTLEQRYLGDEPGAPDDTLALPTQQALGLLADRCIEQAAQNAERIWWVMFSFAPEQFASAGVDSLTQATDWLNQNYTTGDTLSFNDLQITLYSNRRIPFDRGECHG